MGPHAPSPSLSPRQPQQPLVALPTVITSARKADLSGTEAGKEARCAPGTGLRQSREPARGREQRPGLLSQQPRRPGAGHTGREGPELLDTQEACGDSGRVGMRAAGCGVGAAGVTEACC